MVNSLSDGRWLTADLLERSARWQNASMRGRAAIASILVQFQAGPPISSLPREGSSDPCGLCCTFPANTDASFDKRTRDGRQDSTHVSCARRASCLPSLAPLSRVSSRHPSPGWRLARSRLMRRYVSITHIHSRAMSGGARPLNQPRNLPVRQGRRTFRRGAGGARQ